MAIENRSDCPINLTTELLGDRWTLLILRDIIFAGRRHFRELLRESREGITSSILADRLARLTSGGLLTRHQDPSHKQKAIYTLTTAGVDLVPVLATIGLWGATHRPADPDLAAQARELEYTLPDSWAEFMAKLQQTHGTDQA